jgi:hypothetical protein
MLDSLKKLQDIGGMPSPEFTIETMKRVAESILPDLSQSKKQEIFSEIETGVVEAIEAEKELIEIAKTASEGAGPFGDGEGGGPAVPYAKASGEKGPAFPTGNGAKS